MSDEKKKKPVFLYVDIQARRPPPDWEPPPPREPTPWDHIKAWFRWFAAHRF